MSKRGASNTGRDSDECAQVQPFSEPSTLVAAPFRPLNCSIRLALSALDCASFSALPVQTFSHQLAMMGALEALVAETAARERS